MNITKDNKEIRFVGMGNPPRHWAMQSRTRFVFQSQYWSIYVDRYRILLSEDHPMYVKLCGEIEGLNDVCYDFEISHQNRLILAAPKRKYVEFEDKIPIPKYIVNKIKDIVASLENDREYLNNLTKEEPFYSYCI